VDLEYDTMIDNGDAGIETSYNMEGTEILFDDITQQSTMINRYTGGVGGSGDIKVDCGDVIYLLIKHFFNDDLTMKLHVST
jgi:hypothetical protein